MLKWIGGVFDRLFAVVGALLFSQIPLFMQQYTQRLSGHAGELKIQVGSLIEAASFSSKTLEQLIAKFLSSGDMDFVRQGELMQQILIRFHNLTSALQHLEASTPFTRPFVFLSQIDWKIFHGTLDSYSLGITLSLEGGIYALFGVAFGVLLYRFLITCLQYAGSLFYAVKKSFSN